MRGSWPLENIYQRNLACKATRSNTRELLKSENKSSDFLQQGGGGGGGAISGVTPA